MMHSPYHTIPSVGAKHFAETFRFCTTHWGEMLRPYNPDPEGDRTTERIAPSSRMDERRFPDGRGDRSFAQCRISTTHRTGKWRFAQCNMFIRRLGFCTGRTAVRPDRMALLDQRGTVSW